MRVKFESVCHDVTYLLALAADIVGVFTSGCMSFREMLDFGANRNKGKTMEVSQA